MHSVNLWAEYRTSSHEVIKPNRRQRQRYQNVFFIFGEARSTTALLFTPSVFGPWFSIIIIISIQDEKRRNKACELIRYLNRKVAYIM